GAADPPQYDTAGEDERETVRAGLDPLLDLTGRLVHLAGDDVLARHGERPRQVRVATFHRQAVSHPVDLARGVVVGLEAEMSEERRGTRAHVAERIPAVHDHR